MFQKQEASMAAKCFVVQDEIRKVYGGKTYLGKASKMELYSGCHGGAIITLFRL